MSAHIVKKSNNIEQIAAILENIPDGWVISWESPKRTLPQNSSLHLYFTMLGDALNSAGLDQRKVLKPEIDIPWTTTSVKENLWKPLQLAMVGHDKTSKLDTTEVSKVYEVLNRHTASKLGVSLNFPNRHGV